MRQGRLAAALALLCLTVACGDDDASVSTPDDVPASIEVQSTAFGPGEAIPVEYTCDGDNVAPPLQWSNVPSDADALALVVDDPDAPSGTYTHWLVLDIPVDTDSVERGGVPAGGVQARNSTGEATYTGPCPPGGTHHYRFTVYALASPTGLPQEAELQDAAEAIAAEAIASGQLVGTYTQG